MRAPMTDARVVGPDRHAVQVQVRGAVGVREQAGVGEMRAELKDFAPEEPCGTQAAVGLTLVEVIAPALLRGKARVGKRQAPLLIDRACIHTTDYASDHPTAHPQRGWLRPTTRSFMAFPAA